MIRLLLIDDHAIVRNGLEQLFSSAEDIEVVGSAEDGEAGAELAAALEPDVILMDLSMPGLDGVGATRKIVGSGSSARVVMLSSFPDRERVLEAVNAGAIGYLLKDADPAELMQGVRSAAAGQAPFSHKASSALLPQSGSGDPLTAREREVLESVAEGMANKAIARHLGISEKTVKAHLSSAFSAIGVSDRTQAALWVQRNGRQGD